MNYVVLLTYILSIHIHNHITTFTNDKTCTQIVARLFSYPLVDMEVDRVGVLVNPDRMDELQYQADMEVHESLFCTVDIIDVDSHRQILAEYCGPERHAPKKLRYFSQSSLDIS